MVQDPNSNPFFNGDNEVDQISKRYFFIYEGRRTEPGYFHFIDENKKEIGIKYGMELISLGKYGTNVNETDLKKLIRMSKQYRDFYRDKRCKLDYFVDVMLDQFEYMFRGKSKDMQKEKHKQFVSIRNSIVESVMEDTCCDGFVCDVNYETVREKCLSLISERFHKTEEEIDANIEYDAISPDKIRNFEITDQFCVIRDRDYSDYFTDDYYKKCIRDARLNNIRLFITTPMFEYWLLLHHENDNYPPSWISKESSSKHFVQNKLDVLEGRRKRTEFDKNWKELIYLDDDEMKKMNYLRKNIDDVRFEKYYLNNVRNAMERSINNKNRSTNVDELVSRGGTMIGLLFKELVS